MFRIRRIFDDLSTLNRDALTQVREILAVEFKAVQKAVPEKMPEILRNPFKERFRAVVYVAEAGDGRLMGCALMSHQPELRYCFLDYLASRRPMTGRGVGGALYDRIRQECLVLGVTGLFYECSPDDPALCRDPNVLKQNEARLRFYEGFGARPIVNTAYETPVKPGGDNPPYLVFDPLGQEKVVLGRDYVRQVMASILESKYKGYCSPDYNASVVESVRDDPVQLRAWRYTRATPDQGVPVTSDLRRIALVVTDQHEIHHVRDRGYVESPVRIRTIREALSRTGLFETVPPRDFGEKWLITVHRPAYVTYFKKVCESLPAGHSVYPYVFPIRNTARPPEELAVRAGYYCIDTFTPLNQSAFVAARRAVDCALTAAHETLSGRPLSYALVRPPGHHAESASFGGFCYFGNAAIAANYLSTYGTVAMLDIDYHHGNGQQDIFYTRSDVLTVSIHGHPRFAYPYFSGFADERGRGAGAGHNLNIPLPETLEPARYLEALDTALQRIQRFKPTYLVVCLGLDTARGDPTGTWSLRAADFADVGRRIAAINLPTLVVQEGGYDSRSIGANARGFFQGLAAGAGQTRPGVTLAATGP